MKPHTSQFKNNIKTLGRQLDSKITYTLDNDTIILESEDLNSITPHYEGSILKSVMKQLDIDSNVDIPVETEINYQFGLKVGNSYEYLDFGNYIVYSSKKQEDTRSYKIVAYDKMLYTMKDYQNMSFVFPMTVRSYINSLCTALGLTFANASDTFPNYDRVMTRDVFQDLEGNSIGYTYREAFDQIAEVTASTVCINSDDQLELRYITDTNDTINEEFFKDTNVNFGEKYGPVNSIVLSRSGGSDNVYLRDEQSVTTNGLCEIKISDNQIMNDNDRSEYLPDILDQLDGLEYYLNDFSSPGITYYDLCDRYNVAIDENTYSCIMFNDEINVTQGLEEYVYTEISEQSETDYTKASKTDAKINRTQIIVDKMQGEIEALADKIVDVSDEVTGIGSITLENAYEGTLHRLEIIGNMGALLPKNNQYPSETLIPASVRILVDNETYYELDINYLTYTSSESYDKYVYEDGKQWIERANGNIEVSDKQIAIQVKADSTISLDYFTQGQLKAIYLLQNEYTDTFTPSVDVIAKINLSPGQAEIDAHKISLAGKMIDLTSENITISSNNFSVTKEGVIKATGGDIGGFTIDKENGFIKEIYAPYDYTETDVERLTKILQGQITPTEQDYAKYDFDEDGRFTSGDLLNIVWYINTGITTTRPGKFVITAPPSSKRLSTAKMGFYNGYGDLINGFGHNSGVFSALSVRSSNSFETVSINPNSIRFYNGIDYPITLTTSTGNITCISLTQTSKKESKKNFEKLQNALEIIKQTDIYKYNLKNQNDQDKKHIGFVIGDDFNYREEITSENNDGADIYSMVAVCFKAIQEQQDQIELLKEQIKEMKQNGLSKNNLG